MSDDYFKYLANLTNEISKRTGKLEQMMEALLNLNISFQDKEKMKNIITYMDKINKSQQPSNTKQPSTQQPPNSKQPTNTQKSKSPGDTTKKNQTTSELTGDFIYDIFNSPAMQSFIKEHFNRKKS